MFLGFPKDCNFIENKKMGQADEETVHRKGREIIL